MSRRYEITRSAADGQLQLVYRAGRFERLPFEIRLLAPWVGRQSLDIDALRPQLRTEIGWRGYAIMRGTAGFADADAA